MVMDMTRGKPAGLILKFTLPIMFSIVFQQFYSLIDALIVGQMLGVEAFSAVGCTGNLTWFMQGLVEGMTSGFAIITARRIGAKDSQGIAKSFGNGVILTLLAALVMTGVGVILAKDVLVLLETPAEILNQAAEYLLIVWSGTIAVAFYNYLAYSIRAIGDSRTPMLFLMISGVLNIGLDYGLIRFFHLGVAGAAYATITAQALSSIFCMVYIGKKQPLLQLNKDNLKLSFETVKEQLRTGLPMGFQESIIAVGNVVIQYAINGLGVAAVAAVTAAQRAENIIEAALYAFGMAMATYSAQNYGASKIQRVRAGVRQCLTMALGLSLVLGAGAFFFGGEIARLFLESPTQEIIDKAGLFLKMTGATFWVLTILFVLRSTLQGVGNTRVPMIAGIVELGARIVAALALTAMFGYAGICISTPLGWILSDIPLIISYFLTMRRLKAIWPEESLPVDDENDLEEARKL